MADEQFDQFQGTKTYIASEELRHAVNVAVALGSTMGVALAADLFTLFLFYELLTLSTYPLVTHKRDAEAM